MNRRRFLLLLLLGLIIGLIVHHVLGGTGPGHVR
jgi:uncharacterized membrane protein SpoIIM required for sporulation